MRLCGFFVNNGRVDCALRVLRRGVVADEESNTRAVDAKYFAEADSIDFQGVDASAVDHWAEEGAVFDGPGRHALAASTPEEADEQSGDPYGWIADVLCATATPVGFPSVESFIALAWSCETPEDRRRLLGFMADHGIAPSTQLALPFLKGGLARVYADPQARVMDADRLRDAEEVTRDIVNNLGIPLSHSDILWLKRLSRARTISPLCLLPVTRAANLIPTPLIVRLTMQWFVGVGLQAQALRVFDLMLAGEFGETFNPDTYYYAMLACTTFPAPEKRVKYASRVIEAACLSLHRVGNILFMYAAAAAESGDLEVIDDALRRLGSRSVTMDNPGIEKLRRKQFVRRERTSKFAVIFKRRIETERRRIIANTRGFRRNLGGLDDVD
eukprot:Opistho-2@95590